MKDLPPSSGPHENNGLLSARLLVSLVSLTLVGLGFFSIFSEHYYGSSNKLGRAEVSLWGVPAVIMGVGTVCLGLAPLALWFSSRKAAVLWVGLSLCGAAMAFVFAYHLLRG